MSMLLGVGISFYAEKFWGRRAYLVGWLAPLILFATLYALYHLWLRLLSCIPEDRVCGEPLPTLALIFIAVLAVVALANATAQYALYLFRHPPVAAPAPGRTKERTSFDAAPVTANGSPEPAAVETLPLEGDAPSATAKSASPKQE